MLNLNNKLETISNLFEGKEIRSIWDNKKEDYYFSVVDVIGALTESPRPRKYWNALKTKLDNEGSQLSSKLGQLKLKSKKDGKSYLTDVLDTKGILRLIESVSSPKAEPFKVWLANLGSERIDEVFDPEIAARDIATNEHPQGLNENMKVAKRGGKVANDARISYEKETKKSAISNKNALNYQYALEQQKWMK